MNFETDQLEEYERFIKLQITRFHENPNLIKNDPMYIGKRRAFDNAPQDEYTPSFKDLSEFAQKESEKSEKSEIKDLMIRYRNRKLIAQEFIFKCNRSLSEQQYDNIFSNLTDIIFRIYSLLIELWRTNAKNAEKAYNELMKAENKKKKKKKKKKTLPNEDDELCIICLDELRSTKYKPCNHRVCCNNCAESLWQHDKACPLCRNPCEEP